MEMLATKVGYYAREKEVINKRMKELESFSKPLLSKIKEVLNKNDITYYASIGRAVEQLEKKMAYTTNKYLNENSLNIENSKDIVKLCIKPKSELEKFELNTHYEFLGKKGGFINKSTKIVSIANCVSFFSDNIGDNYLLKNNQGITNESYYLNLNNMLETYVGLSFDEIGKNEYTSRYEEYLYFAKTLRSNSKDKNAIVICTQNLEYHSKPKKAILSYSVNVYI